MGQKYHLDYSVVIPIYNEEENLVDLFSEISSVLSALGKPWELIFVDDGSTDHSLSVMRTLAQQNPTIRILSFTRNCGQSNAFAAGFASATGRFVITLDGDRQNDPRDIPKLVEAIQTADLVVGWRLNRKDPSSKKIISRFSNALRRRICDDGVHDTGCSLKVFRAEALKKIKLYQGMHRFLPALFRIEGLRIVEVPVHHRERTKGISKYHFWNRSIGPLIDLCAVFWMRKRHLCYEIREDISYTRAP